MSQTLRRCAAGLAASAFPFLSWSAHADTVEATRSDKLVEKSHEIRIVVDRGHATLVVQRSVFNGGERHDQALFHIDLPGGAVATGLRTLGTLNGRPHWFDGDLLEAEEAAERYRELTGIGGYYPKDPALLSWRARDHLALQVFPCPPNEKKTVEYTLELPTTYEAGRHVLTLPRIGTDTLAANATVRAAQPRDLLIVDGNSFATGSAIRLDDETRVELVPFHPEPVEGALGMQETGHGNAVSRWHLDVAARISEVPLGAHVVIAIDASRSMGQDSSQAATAAARAYLAHFGSASVEVIDFDRRAHRRYGRFVSPDVAARDLRTRQVALGNGSNVDAALDLADQLLANETGPTRIVLMTDARHRSSLGVGDLEASLHRSHAILHLATIASGSPGVTRNDEHEWAPVPRKTGGLFWDAFASLDQDDAEPMTAAYEEWARPLRIDRVGYTAQGGVDLEVPYVLDEGDSLERLVIGNPVAWVELTGELWSQPYRKVLKPDADESRRWSALVFGQDEYSALTEPEMMALAMHGGAVSPVTSYLAIEPGVRPSTEGLVELGRSGIGAGGGGRGEGIGLGSIGTLGHGGRSTWDPEEELRQLLAPAWKHCGGAPDTAQVVLETTLDEVVDVPEVTLDTQDATLRSCLLEATWNLALSARFHFAFRRFEIGV